MHFKEIGLTLCDLSLHDLMYLRPGRVKLEELRSLACALDAAGVPLIKIGTGDVLGRALQEPDSRGENMQACLQAIEPGLKRARMAIQLEHGAAAAEQLPRARDCGVATVFVTANWLDAALIAPQLRLARKLGFEVVGTLMIAHETPVELLVRQAQIMEAEGASCITLADCAALMFSADVRAHMQTLRDALSRDTELGFHGHASSIASALSNSLAAIEGGARRIEASLALPGVGHTPIDALCAICNRMGAVTGVDAYQLSDVGESLMRSLDYPFTLHDLAPPAAAASVPPVERRSAGPVKRVFA